VVPLLTESLVRRVFERAGYLAPFLILLGAGAGLPVPEEVTMAGSGFLLFQEKVRLVPILVTCYTATLLGDSIPFWLGRKYGMSALRFPIVARIVHPERMALLEERFQRHGSWAVFTCRFLPGVRLPGWFMAGTLGMSYVRFLIFNGAAALIMTPCWVLLGRAFGERIEALEGHVKHLNQIMGFAILALILGFGVRVLVRRRERQLQALAKRRSSVETLSPPEERDDSVEHPPRG